MWLSCSDMYALKKKKDLYFVDFDDDANAFCFQGNRYEVQSFLSVGWEWATEDKVSGNLYYLRWRWSFVE